MIYFITPQYLKINTPITANVDITEIQPLIKAAADGYVRSILGTFFYDDLLLKYNNQTLDTPPVTDEVTIVQDYIQYAVAWRTCAEAVMSVSLQLKNKGVQSQSGDFSAAADRGTIALLFHHYRDKADFYDQRLMNYLIENKDLYPFFLNPLNNDSIVPGWPKCGPHQGNVFASGITII